MWLITEFVIIFGIIAGGIWMYAIVCQLERIADVLKRWEDKRG